MEYLGPRKSKVVASWSWGLGALAVTVRVRAPAPSLAAPPWKSKPSVGSPPDVLPTAPRAALARPCPGRIRSTTTHRSPAEHLSCEIAQRRDNGSTTWRRPPAGRRQRQEGRGGWVRGGAEGALDSGGGRCAAGARARARPPGLELHSIQRLAAAHRQVLPPPLGEQAQTRPQDVRANPPFWFTSQCTSGSLLSALWILNCICIVVTDATLVVRLEFCFSLGFRLLHWSRRLVCCVLHCVHGSLQIHHGDRLATAAASSLQRRSGWCWSCRRSSGTSGRGSLPTCRAGRTTTSRTSGAPARSGSPGCWERLSAAASPAGAGAPRRLLPPL
jgi:hypothetical protein